MTEDFEERLSVTAARLMNDVDRRACVGEQLPSGGCSVIQRARTLASARDEQCESAVSTPGRDVEEVASHRHTCNFRSPSREIVDSIVKVDQRMRSEASHLTICQTRDRVWLHDGDRHASEKRGQNDRTGDIAAHAEHSARPVRVLTS